MKKFVTPHKRFAKQTDILCRISFSPDGSLIASPSEDGTLIVWNIESEQIEFEINNPNRDKSRISSVDWDPSASGKILAFGGKDTILWFWDIKSNEKIDSIVVGKNDINGIRYSSDGRLIAIGTDDRHLLLYSTTDKKLVSTLRHGAQVQNIAWKPDNQIIASACWDQQVRLWNANNGVIIGSHSFHDSPVNAVVWHPTQDLLASGSNNGIIVIWDGRKHAPRSKWKGHEGAITSMVFCNNGGVLASKGKDDKVFFWQRVSENEWKKVGQIDEPSSNCWSPSVAFNPLRSLLASTGSLGYNGDSEPHDRTVDLWDVAELDNEANGSRNAFKQHVFLSHNSKDKPTVKQLGEMLKQKGLKVWLDEWDLLPGRPWQDALEEIIRTCGSVVVFIGADDLGQWQTAEMRACLSQLIKRKLPVIPVLLPNAPLKLELPLFLEELTWVDLRGGVTGEGLNRLVLGITGKKPSR